MEDLMVLAFDAIKRNVNSRHGVIAAATSPGGEHKDYLHMWPRDSLLVAMEIGKFDRIMAEKIVENVLNLPHESGMLYQRYEQDATPDPHGWCNTDDSRQLDQDALKFVALSLFPNIIFNRKEVAGQYREFLNRIASKKTSTDVWEQKRGYFFYTTAAILWGLKGAQAILKIDPRHKKIEKEMLDSIESFYDKDIGCYVKSPSEKIIDLEVALGFNVIFESGIKVFDSKEKLRRVVLTLEKIESDLCYSVDDIKIPIRYRGDFWNGETVGSMGECRPWPMGCAMISQSYCYVANAAISLGDYDMFLKSLKNAERWLLYARSVPNIESFPEQVDYDGSLPQLVPRPLSWCAAEMIKAGRMFQEIKSKRKKPYCQSFYLN